jgi:HEAT repeat protein
MARSAAFQEFLAGVNAPVTLTRDALDEIPDIGALYELDGEERIEAERILIAKLAENDGRVATALADAGCVEAIPALIEATTETAAPIMRVFAARALLRLGDYSGRTALVQMLRRHDGSGSDRGGAARLLAEFPDPDKEILLEAASTDPDSTARSQATDALLTVVGLDEDDTRWGEVLLSIAGRLLSSLSAVRDEAVAELRAILARWEAGETAEQLGLTWHADMRTKPLRRFVDSFESTKADFPIEGLRELTGRERVLLENLVLLRLHADRRAVRAAGRLGVRRAIEPLRELLGSAKGHAREEIKAVLDSLTS